MKKLSLLLLVMLAAALGMTSQAENRFYIDDLLITPEDIGTTLAVPVKASFDERVNYWDLTFTLPDGMVLDTIVVGSDFWINYEQDHYERLFRYYNNRFLAYDTRHDNDPNCCWNDGQYDQMMTLYLNVTEDFSGGSIVIHSQSACRFDPLSGPYATAADDDMFFFDVDGDGAITIGDVSYVAYCILLGYYYTSGDCDDNGIYDIADLMNITTFLLTVPLTGGYGYYYEYDLHDSMFVVDISNNVRPVGDIDNNGKIEISDLSMLIDVLLQGYDSEFEMEYADVDGDGEISIADVARLIDILMTQ